MTYSLYPERVIVYCHCGIPWGLWPIDNDTVICPRCHAFIDSRAYSLSPYLRAQALNEKPDIMSLVWAAVFAASGTWLTSVPKVKKKARPNK